MIAVRPPEYWPRLEYIAHLSSTDVFVLADTFQYSRQSFQNRARLRTPQGWQWISIPLNGGQHGKPIRRVEVDQRELWAKKHWRALEYNYRSTPYFEFYESEIHDVIFHPWHNLADLTCQTVACVAGLFGIGTPVVRASAFEDHPSNRSEILHKYPDQQPLTTREAGQPDTLTEGMYRVFRYHPSPYRQNFPGFEMELSALDLLFNYGPEARRKLMEGVELA